MNLVGTLINWVIGALVIWLLSLLSSFLDYPSFFNMRLETAVVPILLVALIVGLVSALVVLIVKKVLGLKGSKNTLFIFLISLAIDVFALWVAARFVDGFSIGFPVTAIIVAAVLSVLNVGFGMRK